MVDPTLDPFLTTSYFPLKLLSRLILCIVKIELIFSSMWLSLTVRYGQEVHDVYLNVYACALLN